MSESISAIVECQPQSKTESRCKGCGSTRVVRHGSYKGVQKWLCRDCGHVGIANGALPGMRIPAEVVAQAKALRERGLPFTEIREELGQRYGVRPSTSTLHGWFRQAAMATR